MAKVKITLRRGFVGCTERQRETIRTLGLRRIRDSVVREDTATVRGAVRSVLHMLDIEEVAQ